MQLQPIKSEWIVFDSKGVAEMYTLSYTRRAAIKAFEKSLGCYTWGEVYRKYGYRCKKVNIIFEPVK